MRIRISLHQLWVHLRFEGFYVFYVFLVVLLATNLAAAQEQQAAGGLAIDAATLPRDLSPWGMFMAADSVVKAVMIGLALASVATWTVWLAKTIELIAAKRRLRSEIKLLGSGRSAGDAMQRLQQRKGLMGRFISAAVAELQMSGGQYEKDGIKERVSYRALSASRKPRRAASREGPACWPRSGPSHRSWACSARSGAS
jgi:hypothetical protein